MVGVKGRLLEPGVSYFIEPDRMSIIHRLSPQLEYKQTEVKQGRKLNPFGPSIGKGNSKRFETLVHLPLYIHRNGPRPRILFLVV